jgi:hypothetical protein
MATGPDGIFIFYQEQNGAVYKITFTGSTAPVITNQPQSISVSEGQPGSFLLLHGTQPITYQWRKNAVNISGATSATYTISSLCLRCRKLFCCCKQQCGHCKQVIMLHCQ